MGARRFCLRESLENPFCLNPCEMSSVLSAENSRNWLQLIGVLLPGGVLLLYYSGLNHQHPATPSSAFISALSITPKVHWRESWVLSSSLSGLGNNVRWEWRKRMPRMKHPWYETQSVPRPKLNAVCSQHHKVWFAWPLKNDSIFVSSQWIDALVAFSDHTEHTVNWGVESYFRKTQANICRFVSLMCLSRQKRYSAGDLIDILLGQENWGQPNGRQIHFPKVMGLAAGDSLLKDISELVKATIRDARGIQIIPLIQIWQPGPQVNVVALMQMVIITVSSWGGSGVTETGSPGLGRL